MRRLLLSTLLFLIIGSRLHAQNCSVNAGINTTICLKDTMVLNGTRSGLLGNGSVSVWSQISGSSVVINSPNSLITKKANPFRIGLLCFTLQI